MHNMRCVLGVCSLLLAGTALAQGVPVGTQQTILMEVFVRSESDISANAQQFAEALTARTDGLQLVVHDVLKDREQLSRLWQITRRSGREKPVVPAFYCCNQLYFGFKNPTATGPLIEDLYTADVYTRSTCPKCKKAKEFIQRLQPRWPAVRFRIHEITGNPIARARWQELCRSTGKLPGLPTIDFGGQIMVGYQGDLITGVALENLIQRVSRNGNGDRNTPPTIKSRPAIQERSHRFDLNPRIAMGLMTPVPTLLGALAAQDDATSTSASEFDDVPLPDDLDLEALENQPQPTELDQVEPAREVIDVPVFGELRPNEIGFPLFTFLIGLVDGFNPCAMWILVFLLSVLVNIKDRRKILLIAGTFVVVSGVAYFAFMAAWLNVFMLIGFARPVQVLLGVLAVLIGVINVKDFFAFKQGISLSIPESAKPGLYRRVREIVSAQYLTAALSGVIALAVIVNMVELLCTAGLPALYTQVLTMQEFPVWKNYAYLALYISAYMLDDTILLGIVVATLSHRKLQEREGRWLKLLSGVVILLLGLVMIFRPDWLQLGQ